MHVLNITDTCDKLGLKLVPVWYNTSMWIWIHISDQNQHFKKQHCYFQGIYIV